MSSVPLKLKDTADFQEITTSEENYLAYQVGLGFAALDSSSVNQLGVNLSGDNRTVGTFTDTSYDSAVGTHSNLLSTTSISTVIRQKAGTATISGNDYRVLVSQRDSDGQRIVQEMDDTKLNVLLDRINSRIYTSDYPGTYKLATSAPSGDYSVNLANVMTDTRTDGHSLQYNIYQRNTMTAPTTVRPFAIKRSSGQTGTYQGLQEMTDGQIKYSLGIKARNRTSSTANSVGTYKILSSSTGTPTNAGFAGTWQAKGTATDTRQTVSNVNYTRTRNSTYSRLRTSTYSANYTRNRSSTFLRNSTTTRSSTFSATYVTTRTSSYSPSFVGDYIGNFTTTTANTYTRTRASTLDFLRTSTAGYTGNYARLLSFTGNFIGNFTGNYLGQNFARSFYRTLYVSVDQETFQYSSFYAADYSRNRVTDSTVTSTRTSTYTRGTGASFTGNYSSQAYYLGNYVGNVGTTSTRTSQRVTANNFARNFAGNYARNFQAGYSRSFARDFIGTSATTFTGNFTGDYIGDFAGNFTGNFTGNYTGLRTYTVTRYSTHQKHGSALFYSRQVTAASNFLRTSTTSSTRIRNFLDYTRTSTGSGAVRTANFMRFRYGGTSSGSGTIYYTGDYTTSYSASGTYVGNYSGGTALSTRTSLNNRTVYFTGNFARNFTSTFTGNYSRNFARTRSSNFTGASSFTRAFAGNYLGNYSRVFSANYAGNYARNFAGNYTGNYNRNFIGDYARTFTGNYTSTTIGSGNENIETYTMYVRIV